MIATVRWRFHLVAPLTSSGFQTNTTFLVSYFTTGGAKVYDVTKYLNDHPGGPEIMMEFAGTWFVMSVFVRNELVCFCAR